MVINPDIKTVNKKLDKGYGEYDGYLLNVCHCWLVWQCELS